MLAGWERADWFAPQGVERATVQLGPGVLVPLPEGGALAVREAVGMYDLTSMHNYLVQGPDGMLLQDACANNVAVPVGRASARRC